METFMPLSSDALIARVQLRNKLMRWRFAALLLTGLVIAIIGWKMSGSIQSDHVAKVMISGVITDDDKRHEMFQKLETSAAKAVIIVIDSPGGGVTASEQLYNDIRSLAAKKPVVALVQQVAASGGYMTALATDRIFVNRTSITGSIGVLVQFPNISGLMEKVGISLESVKSSPLKAAPNGMEPTSPQARAALEAVVLDSYGWFKGLVAERRKLDGDRLNRVSDGRIFTGSQALELGLVDQIGSEKDIRDYLQDKHKVSKDLSIQEWKPEKNSFEEYGLAKILLSSLLHVLGFSNWAESVKAGSVQAFDAYALDGVLAIWQPERK
jgi:protease-4